MKIFHKITMMLSLFLLFAVFTSGIITATSGPTPIESGSDYNVENKDDNNDIPDYVSGNITITTEEKGSSSFDWLAGTVWQIRDFDGRIAKERTDNAQWIFYSSNKAGAYNPYNYWNGDWKQLTDDRVQVNIGSNNVAELIFISQNYFIAIDHATKNFRYTGERII